MGQSEGATEKAGRKRREGEGVKERAGRKGREGKRVGRNGLERKCGDIAGCVGGGG